MKHDMRAFLLQRYRETLPAALERPWQALLGKYPDAPLAEHADAVRWFVNEKVMAKVLADAGDRYGADGALEFGIIVPGIIRQVTEEYLAGKLAQVSP